MSFERKIREGARLLTTRLPLLNKVGILRDLANELGSKGLSRLPNHELSRIDRLIHSKTSVVEAFGFGVVEVQNRIDVHFVLPKDVTFADGLEWCARAMGMNSPNLDWPIISNGFTGLNFSSGNESKFHFSIFLLSGERTRSQQIAFLRERHLHVAPAAAVMLAAALFRAKNGLPNVTQGESFGPDRDPGSLAKGRMVRVDEGTVHDDGVGLYVDRIIEDDDSNSLIIIAGCPGEYASPWGADWNC